MNEHKEEIIMKIDKEIEKLNKEPQTSLICIGNNSDAKENWCVIGDNIDTSKKLPDRSVVLSLKDVTIVIGETVLGKKNQLNKILRDFGYSNVKRVWDRPQIT